MNQREAGFDPVAGQSGGRHQGAVFRIDVGPGDTQRAGAARHIDRVGKRTTIARKDRDRCALAVAAGIRLRRRANADLVDQRMDDRIGDFRVTGMYP